MAGTSTTPATGGGGFSARLMEEVEKLAAAAARPVVAGLGDRIGGATRRLTECAAKGRAGRR